MFDFGVGVDERLADGVFEAGVFVEVVDRFDGFDVGEVFVMVVDGLADSVHGGRVVSAHSVIVLSLCAGRVGNVKFIFRIPFLQPKSRH